MLTSEYWNRRQKQKAKSKRPLSSILTDDLIISLESLECPHCDRKANIPLYVGQLILTHRKSFALKTICCEKVISINLINNKFQIYGPRKSNSDS